MNANDIGLPTSTTNIGEAITKVIAFLFALIGGLAVVFIIVGGLQMVTSAGSPQRFKQGRETVLYAVVGLVVAIGAYAAVTFIGSSL
ncbi:MAG TPA: hypothetical protein VLF67_03820 [Candidatus Saccharimonas sp.]|nr:hypothetical protein [Candidatus Saccharimonas sp.]